MRTHEKRTRWAALLAACLALAQGVWAQVPDDETPGLSLGDTELGTRGRPPEPDKPTMRLQWQRQAWGLVTPQFRANTLAAARTHNNIKNLSGPKWVSIGPFGQQYGQNGSFTGQVTDSGRARAVLPHPTNAEVVYVLTSGGGLWRTSNWSGPGTQWQPLTDDLPTTGGGSVAFGRNANTMYLGLGDPYDQILVGGAVAKSRNGGNSWATPVELGSAVSVRDVKVDTSTNVDVVLVATDSGLYRSADEGVTYSGVAGFEGQSVWSLARTSAGWLVSAQPCAAASAGLQCGFATTLYLSTDRGATWSPVSNAGNVFSGAGRTTLAVGQPGDAVVYAYASTVGDAQMRDVFRSADGGRTWVANNVNAGRGPTNPVAGSMDNLNICQAQCWYNQMLVVDPRDASRQTVWIGGNLATARSVNGGGTWTLMTWWLPGQTNLPYAHADHHAAAFKLTGNPSLILGNDGGITVTENSGATFTTDRNNGLVSHLFYTITGSPKHPNLVMGGLQDNGTRLRVGNDGTFNQVIGGDGFGAAYSRDNANTVLGSSQGSSMRTNFSNNPPSVFQNWAGATSGLSDVGFGFFTSIIPAPYGLDPTGRVFFHFSNARVWRSTNGGLNWSRIASAISPTSPGLPAARRFRSAAYNLSVSPQDLNRLAVGAGGGFLDVTTDGGATWTDINLIAAVPGYQGFVSSVQWQNNQTLWITSAAQASGSARVIKATVAPNAAWSSATFQVRQGGLPDVPVNRVYVDPRDASGNTVYAATHVGIYATRDGGNSWAPYGIGLPTVRVNDIYMPPDGGFIRIATYGRGVWELPQLELVKTELADNLNSCDRDGVLDNGEVGTLAITLANQGPNNVNQMLVTVTSTNPHVSFPNGNVVAFPPVQKYGQSTGGIAVALNGAVGLEAADFQISISAPELGQPTPIVVNASHRVNYDERPTASNVESAATANHGWTVGGGATTMPNVLAWQRRALSTTSFVWWGPDNNGQSDGVRPEGPDSQTLTSPVMRVGNGPLTLSFKHRFSFESGGWDGGIIELSADGGASWVDVGSGAYNGFTNSATAAPIGASRQAFVNRMIGWPSFSNVSLNLGSAYAGRDVRLRFRIGADESTGAPGWEVTDIAVGGLTSNPFAAALPHAGICLAR